MNFPTGATTAVFTLNAVNNTLLDSDEEVTVFVSVPGLAQISRKVIVRDNESATLILDLMASVSEGVSAEIYGTLRASRAPDRDITVQLSVSPASQVSVPGSVIIPAGKTEVQVSIRAWDDDVIDGTVTVTIRAAYGTWVPGQGTIQVLDNELKGLLLTVPSMVSEYDGSLPMSGIVDAGGIVQTDLKVMLASNDVNRLAVQNEVIIRAGARLAYFDLRAIDDDLRDGDHNVRITASANSYGSVNNSVLVRQGTTSIDVLELPVFDMVYSPVIRRLVGSSKKYPGSLLLIDPRTREVTNEIPVSGIPGPLALASDGRTIYVGLKDQPSCEQFDLITRQSTRVFSIRAQAESQLVRAESLVGSPLSPDLVVISKAISDNSPRHSGVVAYQNGIARLSTTPSGFGSNVLAFGASGGDLFGLTTEGATRKVIDLNVDADGVREETVRPSLARSPAAGLRHVEDRLFFSDGTILDAQTLALISQLPAGADLCPDPTVGRLFGIESLGSGQILRSYKYPSLELLDTWNLLGIRGTASRLLRWDLDGLAFRTSGGQIAILRTPQLPVAPAANLIVSPSELIRFEGAPGGSFSPVEVSTQLVNSGLQAMNWSASPSQPWLQVQPTSGTLAPGASIPVRVSVNSLAESLGVGTHTGAVTFQNLTNSAGNLTRQVELEIAVPNTPPTISRISDQMADEGTTIGPLPFAVGDAETSAGSLLLTVVSSNPALFPENQIVIGGTAASRTLTLVPTPQAFGSAEITVYVNDGRSVSSSTFLISISERPDAPSLEPIANQTMQEDKTLEIPIIITDPDTSLAKLSVTGLSSNGSLVPNKGLFITKPTENSVRLVVVPAANAFGSTQIDVKVSDGAHSVTRSFMLTVEPVNDPPTLDVIQHLSISAGGTPKTISLTGISSGYLDSAQPLAVTATANPSNALQSMSVLYGSPAPTGSLLLTPSAEFKGNVYITVTVSDGELEFQRIFQIGVGVPRVTAFNPATAKADSVVMIQGDNFGVDPAKVKVFFPGSLKAEVLNVNPSEIQVRVPRNTVSGRINVAVNGYAMRPSFHFTVPYATTGNISPSWFGKSVALKGPLDNRVSCIRSADLNDDSKPDLVTVGTKGIRIYRNEVSHNTLHESSFKLVFSETLPAEGVSVEAADLDGDGRLDLVVGAVNYTFVYPNTSTGGDIRFGSPIQVNLTNYSFSQPSAFVDVGDLNNDGKLDILAAACPGIGIDQLLVVQNQSTPGNFNFSNRFLLESGTSPDEAEIVDLDLDGNLDLVVGSFYYYRSSTLRNLGGTPVMSASNFAPAVTTSAQIGRDSVECFDVNRDGKPEINFIAGINSTLVMYPNNSTPGTITLGDQVQKTVVGNVRRLSALDVNADGWLDVVGPGLYNTFISQNNQQTTVGASSLLTHVVIPFDTSSPNDICMADFDGDGRPDFATATNGGSGMELFKNNHATGTVPAITSFSPRFGRKGALVTILGSGFSSQIEGNAVFVGGALAQIISASSTQLKILVPEDASGGRIAVTSNGLSGYSVETFEFVKENGVLLGANSLKPRVNFEVGPNTSEIISTDVDGDGRQDVIVTRSSPSSAVIFRNLTPPGSNVSNASFAAPVTVSLPGNPYTTRLEDLDGDNRPELVFSTGSGINYTINYLRNTGSPGNVSFSGAVIPITGKSSTAFAVGDLNGDGKKDIVWYYYEGAELLFISQNTTTGGVISFSTPARSDGRIGPNNIDLKDFNGDGKLDIALRDQYHLWIVRNDSTISAIVPGPIATQIFSTDGQTAIGDIDGSGLPEGMAPGTILKYSLINHGAAWSSTSLFGNSSTIPIVSKADALALADLDGDGLPEFIYVTTSNSKLTFMQNLSTPGRVAVGAQFQTAAPGTPKFVLAQDVNADGLRDMIVLGSMEFSVYQNQRQNTDPTIAGAATLSVLEDQTSGPLQIVVSDSETLPVALVVTATSSDTAVLSNQGIHIAGQGALRTVQVTPEPDRFGTVNVTLTVSDGSATTSMTVIVTIQPVNDSPNFTAPPVAFINENGGETLIQLNGINAGSYEGNQALTLVTSASHPELLARRSVDFQPASSTASIKLNLSSFSLLSLQSSLTPPHIAVTVMDNGGVANNGENARSIDIPARIVSGFEFWRRSRFNESDALSWNKSKPRSDFDGDGLYNLAEYAFGRDPQKPDTLPYAARTVTARDGKRYLEIAFERLSNDERTRYVVEVSENLRDWHSGDAWTEVVETGEQSNGMERQRVRTRQSLGSAGPLFMRVRVISDIAND